MYYYLRGSIVEVRDDAGVVDVGGVGYLVFASNRTLSKLTRGMEASLCIESVVRVVSISLYGVFHPLEKEWFLTLTKVQGVGAKVCLSILSVLSPGQLAQAVSAQDKASFTRASGVGPKLAARIVTELKDKIVTIPVTDSLKEIEMNPTQETENYEDSIAVLSANEDPAKLEDAISALVNLGYQRLEAYKAVNKAAMADPDTDTSGLIKLALKEFARKEV